MVMCSKCHKRVAVVFVTKLENGNKVSEGLCITCAKEMGVPVDNIVGNMIDQLGISPEQLENAENDLAAMLGNVQLPSECDDHEDGGAPAIDLPKIFREAGLTPSAGGENAPSADKKGNQDKKRAKEEKKLKFLTTYCRNLTQFAREGKLDTMIGREKELSRVIQILCRRQKNNPCLIGEPGVGKPPLQRHWRAELPQETFHIS